MRSSRPLSLLLALLASSILVSACSDDDGSDEDEAQITEAIELAATSGQPSICTEQQTQRFNEQVTGEGGEAATTRCEETAAETPAEDVEVTEIEIDGDAATAEAVFTGSFFDGQTLELGLVREDDQWKLDEAIGFVDLDRGAFLNGMRTSLQEEGGGAPKRTIDCVLGNVEALSDEQFEALFLDSDPGLDSQVFGTCFGG